MRHIFVVLVCLSAAFTARSEPCETGAGTAIIAAEYCEISLTWEGCCVDDVVFWCQHYGGQDYTCRLDCSTAEGGPYTCGWNGESNYYFCAGYANEDPDHEFPLACPNEDGDDWHIGYDCDDTSDLVYPGALPECDGILDNNCDNQDDSNELDDDGDGFTECDGDCNDTDTAFHPEAQDECGDGVDHDCDYDFESEMDNDADGYPPCAGDCDDNNALVHSDHAEICDDGIDNDCDGHADGYDTEDCAASDDDDDGASDDDDDDDDDDMVSPRSGPYGLACTHADDGRSLAAVALLGLGLLLLVRRHG